VQKRAAQAPRSFVYRAQRFEAGQSIEVEARDEVSDSVRLKLRGDQRMTIGMRAASKLLVEVR
jgi:hypothetical protein